MPMAKHIILGVHITDRIHHVRSVQERLTEYGCSIRTRLGLHEAEKKFCSPNGLLILEMTDDPAAAQELADKLNAIEGVEVQTMIFNHS
ncbi:MAG: ribose-5-phosphate isomerase A [Planctomycetes bacterium]|nr:ribose-5-phosphate isomerase A [Planctomycetota bacterium]